MLDFKIRRGLSSTIYSAPGVINPRLVIEEGCWYLCTDTAELFLGVLDSDNKLALKRVNEVALDSSDAKCQRALEILSSRLDSLEAFELYQKIDSESELPNDFEADDFNPNITYYIQQANGKVCTYIFDKGIPGYLCTNTIDELVLRAMMTEIVESTLDTKLDSILDTKLPNAVKQTIEGTILYGGDATP